VSEIGQFLKDYGPSFAWIIAAIGWAITNRQANTREKRKEFRSEISVVEDTLKILMVKLEKYLRRAKRDTEALKLEVEIVVLFHSIDLMHERLLKRQNGGDFGLYADAAKRYKEELYDLATGEYFETSTKRIPQEALHPRIQALNTKAFLFVEALHSLFLAKFDGIATLSVVGPVRTTS
jgi:hypothetical protein